MGEYGNFDIAISGQIAENIQTYRSIRTRAAKQIINFGTPVMGYIGDEVAGYNYKLDTAKLVFDADFVTSNTITITVNGESTGAVPFNTDHNTTAADVVTAIKGLVITDSVLGTVNVDCILDPTDSNNRTFLIRTKGLDITVTEDVQAGASQATGTITYSTDQVYLGIAVHIHKEPTTQDGIAQYLVDEAVNVMEHGAIYALVNTPIAVNDDAYIDNAGSDKGAFASSGDTVNCKFKSNLVTIGSDKLAIVGTRGIYKPNTEIAWA